MTAPLKSGAHLMDEVQQAMASGLPPAPPPQQVIALFRDLDALATAERAIRAQLDAYRRDFMMRERLYGLDLHAYRRAIEGRNS